MLKKEFVKFTTSLILLFILPALITLTRLHAFGVNPHRIVAQIAQNYLDSEAEDAILEILHQGKKSSYLPEIAGWPDEIRSNPEKWSHTFPWHYIKIADSQSLDDYIIHKGGDLLWALGYLEGVLRGELPKTMELWQALAFYVHLVADAHQPLHISRIIDNGGNNFIVQWFNKTTNLQSVWDSNLTSYQRLSYTEHVLFIDVVTEAEIEEIVENDTYLGWAKESRKLHTQVYNIPEDRKLSYAYADLNTKLVDQRMLYAGLRLADKLNKIFGPKN